MVAPATVDTETVSAASARADAALAQLCDLFARYGSGDYVGEAVSQEQHALQGAFFADKHNHSTAGRDGADSELAGDCFTAAALLHDTGHMLGLKKLDEAKDSDGDGADEVERMDDCGIAGHENIGSSWLKQLGFPPRVYLLVKHHVNGKRLLCFRDPGYKLSPASTVTLRHQGGPMKAEEAAAYEKTCALEGETEAAEWGGRGANGDRDASLRSCTSFCSDDVVNLRLVDDQAKDPQLNVPGLHAYRARLQRLLMLSA